MKIEKLAPYVFMLGGLFLIWYGYNASVQETRVNRTNGLTSQTYNRATGCFVAVPYAQRTDEYIHSCYDKAEKATGVKIERYGGSK